MLPTFNKIFGFCSRQLQLKPTVPRSTLKRPAFSKGYPNSKLKYDIKFLYVIKNNETNRVETNN